MTRFHAMLLTAGIFLLIAAAMIIINRLIRNSLSAPRLLEKGEPDGLP